MGNIQWAVENYNQYATQKITKPECNRDARHCDRRIKHCQSCDKCWEEVRWNGSLVTIEHYSDFEKIGKKKERCPLCAKK